MLFKDADERNKLRKLKRGEKKGIANGENNRLDLLLAEGRIFCDMPALANRDSILLRDTCLENSLICQPQQRNIHGRIFGGFLMHRAFELAFSTAYTFAGLIPHFLKVDHVDFLRRVSTFLFLCLLILIPILIELTLFLMAKGGKMSGVAELGNKSFLLMSKGFG